MVNSKKILASMALFTCGLFALTGCDEIFSGSNSDPVSTESSSVEAEDPSLGFKVERVTWSSFIQYVKISQNGQEIVCYIYSGGYDGGFSCMSLADSKVILQGNQEEPST